MHSARSSFIWRKLLGVPTTTSSFFYFFSLPFHRPPASSLDSKSRPYPYPKLATAPPAVPLLPPHRPPPPSSFASFPFLLSLSRPLLLLLSYHGSTLLRLPLLPAPPPFGPPLHARPTSLVASPNSSCPRRARSSSVEGSRCSNASDVSTDGTSFEGSDGHQGPQKGLLVVPLPGSERGVSSQDGHQGGTALDVGRLVQDRVRVLGGQAGAEELWWMCYPWSWVSLLICDQLLEGGD